MAKQYWLMKSEPDVYSIEDLERDGSTCWEGVRNYKARNNMRDMKVGDLVLYYHSNAKPPGVVGIARVSKEAYPDHFAFEEGSKYFDPKSDREKPRWYMVDVEFVSKVSDVEQPLGLPEIKADPKLADMELVRYGRLSVQSVKKEEFEHVKKLAGL
jgi:predicted RNA-binding protein with PUA-like domain